MAIDRRTFCAGLSAALSPAASWANADGGEVFAAACKEPSGSFAALVCDAERGVVQRVVLPDRGHDVAVRPDGRECVVFARRPGRFAVAFAPDGSRPPVSFESSEGRHFFGHGAYSTDGRLLFSTEDDIEAGQGVVGVRDAGLGYRRIGEFKAVGTGPHDIVLLSDKRALAVANGGYETGGGRLPLDADSMNSSLSYVDAPTGDVLERVTLAPAHRRLSIRHLAEGVRNTLVFGCQDEGKDGAIIPLVGVHRRGESVRLLEWADDAIASLKGYVGSVAADASGEFAVATSPRGGTALVFEVASGRLIDRIALADVCGASRRHAGGGVLLTSGFGAAACWSRAGETKALRKDDVAWDSHAVTLPSRQPFHAAPFAL